MPALAPYIPPKDAAFNNWLNNFSSLITASPMAYGLVAADAANIASPTATWNAAYAVVTSPSTKSASAVSAKNVARVNAQAVVRPYAQQIVANQGVTNANKVALGLNPRTSGPSPITAPASNPILNVQSAAHLSLIVRYRDSAASPSVKSKPYGVLHCRIYGVVSATPITDPTLLPFLVDATKSPATITFPGSAGGKQVYLAAVWTIRTGGVSPWSPIISFTVPSGS